MQKSLLASLLVASLAAACSTHSPSPSESQVSREPTPSPSPIVLTDYPTGFPTSYLNVVDEDPVILQPVPGGLRHDSSGTLRADDGTTGTYTSTWIENRVPAATIDCRGVVYSSLFTADAPALKMDLTFPGWGHAVLVATKRVVVYPSSNNGSSPAVCDETTGGTYEFEFTNGPIKQLKTGTWSSSADGRLVFDAALAPPGESPS